MCNTVFYKGSVSKILSKCLINMHPFISLGSSCHHLGVFKARVICFWPLLHEYLIITTESLILLLEHLITFISIYFLRVFVLIAWHGCKFHLYLLLFVSRSRLTDDVLIILVHEKLTNIGSCPDGWRAGFAELTALICKIDNGALITIKIRPGWSKYSTSWSSSH